ncbi:MAG TPA: calcium-binding protein [Thermoanaerobaculia bacterium]|jgi:Ca2+-binding RTX toxin-like protein
MTTKRTLLALLGAAALLLVASGASAQTHIDIGDIGEICGIIINCPTGCICGTTCDDTLNGSDNVQDCILGFGGNDRIFGKGENDPRLEGGGGNDHVYGDSGEDTLFGQAGNDNLFGGSESDCLDGGAGTNNLDGGSGANDSCANGAITDCETAVPNC